MVTECPFCESTEVELISYCDGVGHYECNNPDCEATFEDEGGDE